MNKLDVERTHFMITLPQMAGVIAFLGSFGVGLITYGVTTKAMAESALAKATETSANVEGMKGRLSDSIQHIRDDVGDLKISNARIEERLGIHKNQ